MIVLSYHPLLAGPPGVLAYADKENVKEFSDKITALLESLPDGAAEACLWANAGSPFPILLLKQGRAIRDHLVAWAEGDPSAWFELHLVERRGFYALALIPDLRKSLDRQLAAMALAAGRAVPVPEERSVVFRPLHFVTKGPSETFASLRGDLRGPVKVCILDTADVPPDGPMAADPGSMLELGEFRLVTEASPYMESLVRGPMEEAGL